MKAYKDALREAELARKTLWERQRWRKKHRRSFHKVLAELQLNGRWELEDKVETASYEDIFSHEDDVLQWLFVESAQEELAMAMDTSLAACLFVKIGGAWSYTAWFRKWMRLVILFCYAYFGGFVRLDDDCLEDTWHMEVPRTAPADAEGVDSESVGTASRKVNLMMMATIVRSFSWLRFPFQRLGLLPFHVYTRQCILIVKGKERAFDCCLGYWLFGCAYLLR